ncbi:MAG: hypothetical protein M3O22_02385 [Pseudomonadota bacterium]|nr:hypothetical protein [Pseudomonadota bacterium]
MQTPQLKYEIQLDRVQNIALSGIGRTLTFVKFAETGAYDLEKVNTPPRNERQIFSNDSMPPIQAAEFQKWKDDFVAWNLNNAVNEIIESFFVFLEMSYFALHANGDRRRVNSGDVLGEVIKNWQNEVRNNLRTQNKVQALSDKGLQFSDDEKKIIESFWEIRNLLSHNLGIADNRKKLDVDQGKITLKWYRREIFAKLESGREIPLTDDPMPEAGTICLRTKALQTKEIDLNSHISFTLDEVQQIAWMFWLLV